MAAGATLGSRSNFQVSYVSSIGWKYQRLIYRGIHFIDRNTGFASSCKENLHIQIPHEKRRWIRRKDDLVRRRWIEADCSSPSISEDRFLVVSYNILGDHNASKHSDLYVNISPEFLKWDRRQLLIAKELHGWAPDIVCLQEVDRYDDILFHMKKEGLLGSYKKRTGESIDGCAMFWKQNVFNLLEEVNIEFKNFGLRENVAQLSVFEMHKDSSRRVVIGNIHVLFNPDRGDIKLGQVRLLLEKAHYLSEKWGGIPVVLAGDFNLTPDSAVYNFLSSSKLNIKMHRRKQLSGQRRYVSSQFKDSERHMTSPCSLIESWSDEEVVNASGDPKHTEMEHLLNLHSSYANLQGSTRTRGSCGEPIATTYHSKFVGTVDYLWYTEGLFPSKVLDTLPIGKLHMIGGLPCKTIGSDHLALASEFAFVHDS